MELQKRAQGIDPDSGRKRWKSLASKRCPECGVLVKSRESFCPACNALLYCPQQSYRFRIIAAASFLAVLYLIVVLLFFLLLDRLN